MHSDFLSDTELYYSESVDLENEKITLTGDEAKHVSLVMRHSKGDILHITDGKGKIYESVISEIKKGFIECTIEKIREYCNNLANLFFCIPKLKNPDKFEFALEKCVELGITNFIIFNSARGISKAEKMDRWNKILLSAMKQSLRAHSLSINTANSLKDIAALKGEKIFFDQKSTIPFSEFNPVPDVNYYLIFGPEGGFDEAEIKVADKYPVYKLSEARLRSETAIISAASIISQKIF